MSPNRVSDHLENIALSPSGNFSLPISESESKRITANALLISNEAIEANPFTSREDEQATTRVLNIESARNNQNSRGTFDVN